MYLKSLVLKGFKSFADRSVLSLEPGITAVVGPNGSGKSNISDAVLWVLGERNARHLRGQAMEDVIFAGSSARKATGVAEVELILDNSDGTLPVDYSEVAITRRMYRSGESEYLINGTLARRMDVLDILHDSGLGTGTHSIISQGSLDSILQSGPEERRALIEEAAGVLKHKQRKEKSERKLEKMANHVARVRDVVSEVERQLGPLSRKAKRAQTYKELSGELSEAKLALAVDNLRNLQRQWDQLKQIADQINEEIAEKRQAVNDSDDTVERLQEEIRVGSEGAGELSRQYQSFATIVERLDSTVMRIRDRRHSALQRISELQIQIDSSKEQRALAENELAAAKSAAERDAKAASDLRSRVDELNKQLQDLAERRKVADDSAREAAHELKLLEDKLAILRVKHTETKEELTNRLAHINVLEERVKELEISSVQAESDAQSQAAEADAIEKVLVVLSDQEQSARNMVAACVQARETTRHALDEAESTEKSLNAQIEALEEIERMNEQSAGNARAWLSENASDVPGEVQSLSRNIKVMEGKEPLVEMLLGKDLMSLLVNNTADVALLASTLANEDLHGEVSFVLRMDVHDAVCPAKQYPSALGKPLIDYIEHSSGSARAIKALLGDVVVCDSLDDALSAHANDMHHLRFVTEDGSIVWPSGKVTIGLVTGEESQGILARNRHMEELKESLGLARQSTKNAMAQYESAEESLSKAQSESLSLSQQLAVLKGNAQSARSLADSAKEQAAAEKEKLLDAKRKHEEALNAISKAEPDVAELEEQIRSVKSEIENARTKQREAQAKASPLQEQADLASKQLAEEKLELAKLNEREIYSKRVLDRHLSDLERLSKETDESEELMQVKKASAMRLEPLLAIFDDLARSSQLRAANLREKAELAHSSSSSLHARVAEARSASHEAHLALDLLIDKLNENRVENARLEMQVQGAVNSIVTDCNTPLDRALQLPVLDNRPEVEETAFRLSKRIANLGTINPDAASEYEELKERYDYLASQLSDLDTARRSLLKINRVIETRMREDFANTFNEVNGNFQEIFSTLFPGGQGHLSLVDPDDMENTGVEVNAQPAGKRITKMMLMSGGEKSLTALALLFAVYKTRATPFYILDEVEAALDDTNLRRLVEYLNDLRNYTQLIMITHQRRTMEMADVLFGVSMQADGVTKVISQKLDRALEYAE